MHQRELRHTSSNEDPGGLIDISELLSTAPIRLHEGRPRVLSSSFTAQHICAEMHCYTLPLACKTCKTGCYIASEPAKTRRTQSPHQAIAAALFVKHNEYL